MLMTGNKGGLLSSVLQLRVPEVVGNSSANRVMVHRIFRRLLAVWVSPPETGLPNCPDVLIALRAKHEATADTWELL
jgi:hypothetical protein